MMRARTQQGLVIAAALLGGCGNTLQGSLTAEWPAEGKQWTMTPDICESGERAGYFGVDMWVQGASDGHIRAILDPVDGPVVKLDLPDVDGTMTLTPGGNCKLLELHVERQNSRTNKIAHVRGHLRLECSEPALTLQADIAFADCH
jgi:hypothetical protein